MEVVLVTILIAVTTVAYFFIEAIVFFIGWRRDRKKKNGVSGEIYWTGPRCPTCGGISSFETGACYSCRQDQGRLP